MEELDELITCSKNELIEKMWEADQELYGMLIDSKTLADARDAFFDYLNSLERHYFNVYSDKHYKKMHAFEKNNAKECIRVLKNVIRTENETLTKSSALKLLYGIAQNSSSGRAKASEGFLCEFLFLFKGINGNSGVAAEPSAKIGAGKKSSEGRAAALERSRALDSYAKSMADYFARYKTGFDEEVVRRRKALKKDILNYFDAGEDDWADYKWHIGHAFKHADAISQLVHLSPGEKEGLRLAEEYDIPVKITPHYLSLFDKNGKYGYDYAVRAQVLPSATYCMNVIENRRGGIDMDFMGERSTSPIDAITRRYPQILILKPFDSCPQICVYCQRNWELKAFDEAQLTRAVVEKAIGWIREHESISEVLITGGDPLTLSNDYIAWLIGEVAAIRHVERIRIGTRTFVTMPFRINDGIVAIMKEHHEFGKREVCFVTHVEHPLEITGDVIEAVKKIRCAGMSVYNQQVFTYYNSKRFETALLRKMLKISGIDPYYLFNTKGKEETIDFRIPIARIEQERKEEARLLPGLARTDESVFNVPKIGKSHLRAWQDHEPLMIMPDGRRVYRFYPWESKYALTADYIYTDVSIYEYLKRLHADRENLNDYYSIWYYF